MRLTITGTVKDGDKKIHRIPIFTEEIEELIVQKAKDKGIKGYEGRVWPHFDERIESVLVDD